MADYVTARIDPIVDAVDRLTATFEEHRREHRQAVTRTREMAETAKMSRWAIWAALLAAAASWAAVAIALLR
ncbi:MAG: hypothetical protein ACREHG_04950 [Candidatus Saccharimonadales bacterium]